MHGGRGRGRPALTFNIEALGISPGETLPGPVLQPPPAYPPLEYDPTPLLPSLGHMECLKYKTDYLAYYSRLKVECNEESGVAVKRDFFGKEKLNLKLVQLDYCWERFPIELRPSNHKKKLTATLSLPTKPVANIEELLERLEKAEGIIKVEKPDKSEVTEGNVLDEEDIMEDSDNEMDGGTDYNQNYFDNGEGYLDEDDDIDDGPIY